MNTRRSTHLLRLACLLATCVGAQPASVMPTPALAQETIAVSIDGAQTFQRIDGFGVNANGAHWDGGKLAPALDLLATAGGVRIWRVIHEEADWEETNDNDDPAVFNWEYYNQVYESDEFPSLWSTIAHLNQRGDNQVMLNVMGRVPAWMGRTTIDAGAEDEWVEMIASLVYYARTVKDLEFTLLSPTNEVDIGAPEGPQVDPVRYADLMQRLLTRLDALGLGDIRLVPPDVGIGTLTDQYLQELLEAPAIMARVEHFSFHDYGGNAGNVDSIIKGSQYSDRTFWMTEFSAGCVACDLGQPSPDPLNFALLTADHLLRHLLQGAAGAFVYEGYDSYYEHHGPSGSPSAYGMLAYDAATETYAPTKRFYTIAQIYRHVTPGMVRISAPSPSESLRLVAFKEPATGAVAIVGYNMTGQTLTLQGTLTNLAQSGSLTYSRTTETINMQERDPVAVSDGAFSAEIEPLSIFSLTGLGASQPPDTQPPSVSLTSPTAGPIVSGDVTVSAAASDNVGVAAVQFLLDGEPLGEPDSTPPYAISWDSRLVADGEYSLGARATDQAGNSALADTVMVQVANESEEPPYPLYMPLIVRGHPAGGSQ